MILSLKPAGVSASFWQRAKVGKPLPNAGISPGYRFEFFFDFAQADLLDRVHQTRHLGYALSLAECVQLGAGEVDLVRRNRVNNASCARVERGIGAAAGGEQ